MKIEVKEKRLVVVKKYKFALDRCGIEILLILDRYGHMSFLQI